MPVEPYPLRVVHRPGDPSPRGPHGRREHVGARCGRHRRGGRGLASRRAGTLEGVRRDRARLGLTPQHPRVRSSPFVADLVGCVGPDCWGVFVLAKVAKHLGFQDAQEVQRAALVRTDREGVVAIRIMGLGITLCRLACRKLATSVLRYVMQLVRGAATPPGPPPVNSMAVGRADPCGLPAAPRDGEPPQHAHCDVATCQPGYVAQYSP